MKKLFLSGFFTILLGFYFGNHFSNSWKNENSNQNESQEQNLATSNSPTITNIKIENFNNRTDSTTTKAKWKSMDSTFEKIESKFYKDNNILNFFNDNKYSKDIKKIILSEKLDDEDDIKFVGQQFLKMASSERDQYFNEIKNIVNNMPIDDYFFERASLLNLSAQLAKDQSDIIEIAGDLIFKAEVDQTKKDLPIIDYVLPIVAHNQLMQNLQSDQEAFAYTERAIEQYDSKYLTNVLQNQYYNIRGIRMPANLNTEEEIGIVKNEQD